MCPTNTFTAVIAAAGLSTRMGAFNRFFLSGRKHIPFLVLALSEPVPFPVTNRHRLHG